MKRLLALATICLGLGGGYGLAQTQPAAPEPPKSVGALPTGTETGWGLFQSHCMGCHGNPNVQRAPAPTAIRQMSPERIYDALTSGVMKVQGSSLSDDQRRMISIFMSGRPFGTLVQGDAKDMPNRCPGKASLAAPTDRDWNGWGGGAGNARFRARSGLTAAQVPQLKLKWAFGFPGGLSAYGQPTVVAGRVFVGTDTGYVYALDARTGCVFWSYRAKGTVRSAPVVGRIQGVKGVRWGLFFGDFHANAYGLDAETGRELWTRNLDDHVVARITAGPAVYQGRVYVPVSSSEEFNASVLDYPCCTGRGSVAALDAATGRLVWQSWVVEKPRPVRKNSKGVQLYAPAGGSVWNSPTVDPARGALYFGTGDGETEPAPSTTDAVMAVDIKTGRRLWSYQVQKGDAFLGGCSGPARTENCPKTVGPDLDIGDSPILQSVGGHRLLLVGAKDGRLFALDPDRKGRLVWQTQVVPPSAGRAGRGGPGGIYWGGAADGTQAYYGLASGGLAAVRLADGAAAWRAPLSGPQVNSNAASTAIPGAVFNGGMDGKLRALSSQDGHELWSFDTARSFETANKVDAHGGGIGSAGPTVADGMLFVTSGYAIIGDRTGNVLLAFGPE